MSNGVDGERVRVFLDQLYEATDSLEDLFPGRKFTLDGHLVGSVGEVVASYMFGLNLNPASTKGHDAVSPSGQLVEIKLTQRERIALRHQPEHLLVLHRPKGSEISVVFNGPGAVAWESAGAMQKNGQRCIGIRKLAELDALVDDAARLQLLRHAPV
ncbi:DUF6998 domain-containing protein [Rhodovulum sulfidophilum]|uniref:DUF6998 domain-containing protein n=1 Tax=Rhodovulum sulfidophilum TaxID=35806 RepID=UPI000952FB50|nr:hypothetical protein BV379_02815 [Rhodovulum sulfidophilum]